MIPKLVIGVLIGVVLVLLYRGMQREGAAIDPRSPPDVKKILAVLRMQKLPCDQVETFTPVGKSKDGETDGYFALCRDGNRYIYFQNLKLGRVGASSCTDQAFRGYRCPE